jgi:hypothetical protein
MNQLSLDSALAAAVPAPRPNQFGYLLEKRKMAGKVGPRWQQGGKIHLVFCEFIVGYGEGYTHKPGTMKKGDCFSAYTPCNSNGQHIARGVEGWSLDMVDCAKCLKSL